MGKVLQIKSWQVFLTLLLWLMWAVASYTSLRADANESQRRIRDLEQRRVVTEDLYAEGQKALERRLARIEDKLDALDSFNQIDQLQGRRKRHP